MTLTEYQALAGRTINRTMNNSQLAAHALHGMAAELGEIHGIYQKVYQGHAADMEHAKKELGDLLWFIAEFCTAQGWTLDVVAEQNLAKLLARYPQGFDPQRSLHRKEGDI